MTNERVANHELVDLYRQAKRVRDGFLSDGEPAYRKMTEGVYRAVGDMLEGMGVDCKDAEAGQQVSVDRSKARAIVERIADAQSTGVADFNAVAYSRHLMEPGCFEHVVDQFHEAMADIFWVLEALKEEIGDESLTAGKWKLPA